MEDEQTGLTTIAQDSAKIATSTPPNYYVEVLHTLYMWVLLKLPDHYSGDPSSILPVSEMNGEMIQPYTRWVNE
jgi:hypothetical protein